MKLFRFNEETGRLEWQYDTDPADSWKVATTDMAYQEKRDMDVNTEAINSAIQRYDAYLSTLHANIATYDIRDGVLKYNSADTCYQWRTVIQDREYNAFFQAVERASKNAIRLKTLAHRVRRMLNIHKEEIAKENTTKSARR